MQAMPPDSTHSSQPKATLDAARIASLIRESGETADVLCLRTVDSTNSEARRRLRGLVRPLAITADAQTAGRGRGSHSFFSPADTGLYLTVVCPADMPVGDAAPATLAMAVAAARAAEALGAPRILIKWVNDLYAGGGKAAGILTEAVTDPEDGRLEAVICGIGLNLTTADFPDELKQRAGTLGPLDRHALAAGIVSRFLPLFRALPGTEDWLSEYRSRSLVLGRRLTFERGGRVFSAVGEQIDGRGRLIVRMDDGSAVTLDSGEISVRPEDIP